MEKKTICPGCGKIEVKETDFFNVDVLEGKTKIKIDGMPIKKSGVDGINWCAICR